MEVTHASLVLKALTLFLKFCIENELYMPGKFRPVLISASGRRQKAGKIHQQKAAVPVIYQRIAIQMNNSVAFFPIFTACSLS